MLTAALFTIAKTWKEPKCPLTDEWIKKMWNIYKVEYYLAIKKKESLPLATTWMDLEDIVLSEISQTEKDILCYLTYIWNLKKQNSQKQRVEWWLPGAGE